MRIPRAKMWRLVWGTKRDWFRATFKLSWYQTKWQHCKSPLVTNSSLEYHMICWNRSHDRPEVIEIFLSVIVNLQAQKLLHVYWGLVQISLTNTVTWDNSPPSLLCHMCVIIQVYILLYQQFCFLKCEQGETSDCSLKVTYFSQKTTELKFSAINVSVSPWRQTEQWDSNYCYSLGFKPKRKCVSHIRACYLEHLTLLKTHLRIFSCFAISFCYVKIDHKVMFIQETIKIQAELPWNNYLSMLGSGESAISFDIAEYMISPNFRFGSHLYKTQHTENITEGKIKNETGETKNYYFLHFTCLFRI